MIRAVVSGLWSFALAISPCPAATPHKGANCGLKVPPAGSGEETNHGALHKIYPRAKNMKPAYTGCQTVWVELNKRWLSLGESFFEKGELRSYQSSGEGEPPLFCEYRSAQLTGGSLDTCPAVSNFPTRSLAPGCVAELLRTNKFPNRCKYE